MNRIPNRVGTEAGAEQLAATHLCHPSTPPPTSTCRNHLDLPQPLSCANFEVVATPAA